MRAASTSTALKAIRWTLRRKLAVAAGSAVGIASVVGVARSAECIDDLKHIGAIRFGRAAGHVSCIIADYKIFFKRFKNETSEEFMSSLKAVHLRSAHRLLDLACSNGGLFIKVGQHIATLEYLVPLEYTRTLSVLLSQAPKSSFEDVKFVVERELGGNLEDHFTDFTEAPIGAASLAQVHIAKRRDTGELVACKVQHKRLQKNARTDIVTMEFLVNVAHFLLPEFKLKWLVKEVKKNLPIEMDFLNEGKNADAARERYARLKFLKIPKIHYDLSTKQMLTMEFCEGHQINDREWLDKMKIDKHEVCRRLGRLVCQMIFLDGRVHCDPHPGNILINRLPNGNTEIVLLDHGLYLDVNDRFRRIYSDLWMALLNADTMEIKRVAEELGVGEMYGLLACMVTQRSWKSVTQGIRKSKKDEQERQELRAYAITLIPQISEVLARVPREMLLIFKTNDLLRGIEYILGTANRADSLIEVSKFVVRSHYDLTFKEAQSYFQKFINRFRFFIDISRIYFYEYYLFFSDKVPCLKA
ncbi:unnamed protein product, partial [Mesorhabditis belari]|uniref:ABC1 atypical kinase-like domain-containing protein n=1 Tax=Mesorhabditis belari TaxID=2138241 RepID=A0AAF3ELP0_9BILA